MRGDIVEEALREIEVPQVLEAVQQPVGGGGVAARLELPEPDEPRHPGVDRFVEQMLEFAPKPGRASRARSLPMRRCRVIAAVVVAALQRFLG